MGDRRVLSALNMAWESEIEAAQLYRALSEIQDDTHRCRLFERLAESEEKHAAEFSARIVALGGTAPSAETAPTTAQKLMARTIGTDAMLRRMEAEEVKNSAQFEHQAADIIDSH